ncbi:MAG: hypothetical protein AAFY02_09245 [Pseudomonadota bacterium]
MPQPLIFDDFRPGSRLGTHRITLDAALIAAWTAVEPEAPLDAEGRLPPGLLVALAMRGYLAVVTPRPPGNVHAGMDLAFTGAAHQGETLELEILCLDKEDRKGRRWVHFGVSQTVGARPVLTARLTLIWAQ